MNNRSLQWRQSAVLTAAALYFGGMASAMAQPQDGRSANGVFHQPTFTAEDIQRMQPKQRPQSPLYSSQRGVNQISAYPHQRPVFTPEANAQGIQRYIVRLKDQPVVQYDGHVQGYLATKRPEVGNLVVTKGINRNSSAVTSYQRYLHNQQDSVLNSARRGGASAELKQRFTIANNAMVVEMTQQDAMVLAKQTGVASITKARVFELHTDRSGSFLGADKVWDGLVGPSPSGYQGEGMVVGIIDTGINTDHVAFSDTPESGYEFPATNLVGDCETDASLCNNKLIGVRSYDIITEVYSAPEFQADDWRDWYPAEQIRPATGEDYNGHGSHVAATVAGNGVSNTPYQGYSPGHTGDGEDTGLTFPHTQGIAPNAQIISYQVCWPGVGDDPYAGCPEEALLAGIEDAISDGVDVINFSIGGWEQFPWSDPVELAFLAAREAGINVAAAAGNEGAFFATDHTSPWLTSVGATTLDRHFVPGQKTLGDFSGGTNPPWNPSMEGRSLSGGITAPMVYAGDYGDALCLEPFPADTFNGEIVMCDRGDIARVAKAEHVAAGGAGGFVLVNVNWSDNVVSENYVIPGIHIDASNRWNLLSWLQDGSGEAHMATISEPTHTYAFDPALGDRMASFSSMGPSVQNPNYLVPDLGAPGVEIYAANADDQPFTNYPSPSDWTFLSGTSMASPQVAGAMALVQQAHPDWTPAEIQSALMMTSHGDIAIDDYMNIDAWFFLGAGRIQVDKAVNAGLVMNETGDNYRAANPREGGRVEWLNTASLTNIDCNHSCSWLRTVTATRDGSWTASGHGSFIDANLVDITVEPANFSLMAGETQVIKVTAKVPDYTSLNNVEGQWATRTDTNYSYFFGEVQLQEQGGDLSRLPVTAAFDRGSLPKSIELEANHDQGDAIIDNLMTPATSDLTARSFGLVKPTLTSFDLNGGMFIDFTDPDSMTSVGIYHVEVPEGTERFMVEIQSFESLDDDQPSWAPYLNIGFDANNDGMIDSNEEMVEERVCSSTHDALNNYCDLGKPLPGNYWVMVHNVRNPGHPEPYLDRIVVGHAMVGSATDNGAMSISLPGSSDGLTPFDATLSYDLETIELAKGEVAYGAFDVGSSAHSPGNLGLTGVKISRGADVAEFSLSQHATKGGDIIDIHWEVLPNLEGSDRSFQIDTQLPEGLTIVPGSLTHSSNIDSVELTDGLLSLSGIQQTSRDVERRYELTSSLNSEQCRLPIVDEYSDGLYENLQEFGMQPQEWYQGTADDNFFLSIPLLFGKDDVDVALYAQPSDGYLNLSPTGLIQQDDFWWIYTWHTPMSYWPVSKAISPFWRGSFEAKYRAHWEDAWGLTIASLWKEDYPELGDLLYLEFDNVFDTYSGEEFDYQVVMRGDIDFAPNKFEIMMAYDNLGANYAEGSIGVLGYHGTLSQSDGPISGVLAVDAAYDNLDQVIDNKVVLCYDYQGPEASGMTVSLQARVHEDYAGQQLPISMTASIDGLAELTQQAQLSVRGNINVAPIGDLTVAEDGRIDGIQVHYQDTNGVPNTIEVSGDHISAVVHDDNRFDLIPTADFSGTTEVTVTVRDTQASSDIGTTRFTLTVTPMADAPMPMLDGTTTSISEGQKATLDASASYDVDGDNLTFLWEGPGQITDANAMTTEVAELPSGSHQFTLTVTDGTHSSSETVSIAVASNSSPDSGSSSSGSLSYLLLFTLGLLGLRRRS